MEIRLAALQGGSSGLPPALHRQICHAASRTHLLAGVSDLCSRGSPNLVPGTPHGKWGAGRTQASLFFSTSQLWRGFVLTDALQGCSWRLFQALLPPPLRAFCDDARARNGDLQGAKPGSHCKLRPLPRSAPDFAWLTCNFRTGWVGSLAAQARLSACPWHAPPCPATAALLPWLPWAEPLLKGRKPLL